MRPLEEQKILPLGKGSLKTLGPFIYVAYECNIWSVSVYHKCSFRCVYCSTEAQGRTKPALTKSDIVHYLDSFCAHGDDRPLLVGGLSDPYPPEEEQHRLTRFFIEQVTARRLHFQIVTKGSLIERDIDLLKNNPYLDHVCFTVTHTSDEFFKKYEPGAPLFPARKAAIEQLACAAIPVFANICPWIPTLTPVEAIADEIPAEVTIKVAALTYGHHVAEVRKEYLGINMSSAEKVFGKYWTQDQINAAYLDEYKRIGKGKNGNIKWLALSGRGDNFSLYLKEPPAVH